MGREREPGSHERVSQAVPERAASINQERLSPEIKFFNSQLLALPSLGSQWIHKEGTCSRGGEPLPTRATTESQPTAAFA